MRAYSGDDSYATTLSTKPAPTGTIPVSNTDKGSYVEIEVRTPEFVFYKFKVLKPQGGPNKLFPLT